MCFNLLFYFIIYKVHETSPTTSLDSTITTTQEIKMSTTMTTMKVNLTSLPAINKDEGSSKVNESFTLLVLNNNNNKPKLEMENTATRFDFLSFFHFIFLIFYIKI